MQEIERATAARNRVSLSLMQQVYNNAAAMNSHRVRAAEIKARQQLELESLKKRFEEERASLLKRHSIEQKAHAAEATRLQKLQKAKKNAMTKILSKLRNA